MEFQALQLNKVQFAGISILYQLSIRRELLYYPTSCPVQRQVLCRYVWYSTLIFTNSSFSIAVLSSIPQSVSCRGSLLPCQSQERMDVLLRRYVWQPAIDVDTFINVKILIAYQYFCLKMFIMVLIRGILMRSVKIIQTL